MAEQLLAVQYSQDRPLAFVIAEDPFTQVGQPGRIWVAIVTTATGAAPTPFTVVGEFDSLVLNPTKTRTLLTYTDSTPAPTWPSSTTPPPPSSAKPST